MPEPWLRGAIPGIAPLLQPVAHALVMAQEDVAAACEGLDEEELWSRPGGVASVGFHLAHLSGSTERLLTYARGDQLADEQLADLERERAIDRERPDKAALLARWVEVSSMALRTLSSTDPDTLLQHRGVGRTELPSNVLGLLFHVAEHAARHTGQVVTTAKLVRTRER